MESSDDVARLVHTDEATYFTFHCPGCECAHMIAVDRPDGSQGPIWDWNGDLVNPTVNPSLLVQWYTSEEPDLRCHSFVRSGHVEYLNDSTHALAGHTVPLDLEN